MPAIQVRDVPDHIYRLLAKQAERERRSIAQQALAVLARGLEVELDPRERRRAVLRAIKETIDPVETRALSNAAKLIREDRQR